MRLFALVLLACVVIPRAARADEERAPEPASPGIALALATGMTGAAGVVYLVAAEADDDRVKVASVLTATTLMVIGPSAGHLYAGDSGEAVGMSLVRAGGLGVAFYGFSRMVDDLDDCAEACGDHGLLVAVGGLGIWSAAAIYDLIDAPRAAARANARRRMSIVPTGTGLAVAGRF